MTPNQVNTLITDAANYPLAMRVAARLHLAKVTKPVWKDGTATLTNDPFKGIYYKAAIEIWQYLRDIREGRLKLSQRLKDLAEELPLPELPPTEQNENQQ